MPNDRELAALLWLLVVIILMLCKQSLRTSMYEIVRMVVARPVFSAVVILVVWVATLVWLGSRVGIWNLDLATITLFWFGGTAVLLFLNVNRAYSEDRFFSRTIAETLSFSTILAFAVNFFVMRLCIELLLQPLLAILVMVEVVASHQPKYHQVKRVCDFLIALIGYIILLFGVVNLINNWDSIAWYDAAIRFALPIWLTIGLLPYIYLLTVYIDYEKHRLTGST